MSGTITYVADGRGGWVGSATHGPAVPGERLNTRRECRECDGWGLCHGGRGPTCLRCEGSGYEPDAARKRSPVWKRNNQRTGKGGAG